MFGGNGIEFRGKPKEQLYSRIKKVPGPLDTPCWEWQGAVFKGTRYGQFSNRAISRHSTTTHKASWIIHNGPVPEGLQVNHKCDNRICCNPDHLYVGTHSQNMIDRSKRGYVHQMKLSEDKVREMRQLRQQGWGWMKLAKRYGVAQNSIIMATTGQTWAHVDEPIPTYVGVPGRNRRVAKVR